MTFPHAMLRCGYPYERVLGMRRVTTFPVDIAVGTDRIYVIGRTELGVGGNVRMVSLKTDDELGDDLTHGDMGTMADTGQVWPVALLRTDDGNLHILDEGSHTLTTYSADGERLGSWGEHGSGPGQLDRPSGAAFDADGNVWIVDTQNHRLQHFTASGELLGGFGEFGDGPGQFNMPWGIAIDAEGDLYVSDWRNDRVQKLTVSGGHIMDFGTRPGYEVSHPSGIAVDEHGDLYVCERDQNRVVMYDPRGRYVESFGGAATLNRMGREYIRANQKTLRLREMTSLEEQRLLRFPQSVRYHAGRLYICDFGSHRIQIYRKDAEPLSEEQIMAELRAPTLMTT